MARRREEKSPASVASPLAQSGQFAYAGLERTIHEKARLGIMTSLMTQPAGVSFSDLKRLCDLTDGNLNRHLEVLISEGLVQVQKLDQSMGRPITMCYLTTAGRARFLSYLQELQRVMQAAVAATAAVEPQALRRLKWST